MVVKEHLENQGVNLQRFQHYHKSQPVARRRIVRMVGEDITVPVPRTNKEIKDTLQVRQHLHIFNH